VASDNHLNKEEIRLEVLRIVKENGTEYQKKNPLPLCDLLYKWVISGTIRKNLTGKKE
jgi:hypothetical protein